MASKTIFALFFLSCVFCATAQIGQGDIDALKTAWAKAAKKPAEYSAALLDKLVDDVITPVASELLEILDFILDKEARSSILKLLPLIKNVPKYKEFNIVVETSANIITKNIIPQINMLADILNKKEDFFKKNIKIMVEIALNLYHSGMDKAIPVFEAFMGKDWSGPEKEAVKKVMKEFRNVDMACIKRVVSKL